MADRKPSLIDLLTNATEGRIEALQKDNGKAWSALFEPDAKL